MARSEAKRQKKLLRRHQKDKVRHKRRLEAVPFALADVKTKIRAARQYPLHECIINREWRDSGLAVVLVSRRQPNGRLLYGLYLADILCLGVKNTLYEADVSMARYRSELLADAYANEEPIPCSRELAHRVVYGAIAFARQYGFRPNADFAVSQYVLDPVESVGSAGEEIEFGREGKPLYIRGPHDDVRRILRQLDAAAGRGNYECLLDTGPSFPDSP
jgi:hypothetical protein